MSDWRTEFKALQERNKKAREQLSKQYLDILRNPSTHARRQEKAFTELSTMGAKAKQALEKPTRTYCGKKRPPPGTHLGTPYQCLRKGAYVGRKQGIEETTRLYRTHVIPVMEATHQDVLRRQRFKSAKSVVEENLKKRQLIKNIKNEKLLALKKYLNLVGDKLNKDELRSIATKYTGTANAITGYSNMSQAQLTDALVERGFKR